MKSSLFLQAVTKFLFGVLLVGLLVFLSAGPLRYPQGWLSRTIQVQEQQTVVDTGL